MKKAFTMIELILVIVIVGILASVAIPKLSATRDDAKIFSIVTNIRTVVSDMSVYYTSQGKSEWVNSSLQNVTSVPLYTSYNCGTGTEAGAGSGVENGVYFICDKEGGNYTLALLLGFDLFFSPEEPTATGLVIVSAADNPANAILHGVVTDPAIVSLTGGPGQLAYIKFGGKGILR